MCRYIEDEGVVSPFWGIFRHLFFRKFTATFCNPLFYEDNGLTRVPNCNSIFDVIILAQN